MAEQKASEVVGYSAPLEGDAGQGDLPRSALASDQIWCSL